MAGINPNANFVGMDCVEIFGSKEADELFLPIVESGISAGFPSPADDYLDEAIESQP